MSAASPLVVNGWSLYAHPVFLEQLRGLIAQVEARKARDPSGYRHKNSAKRLAAILKLVTEIIPADPAADTFRQGETMGEAHTHWRRAKFFQQYRLFFRYDSRARVIVLAWVNDDATLRAYGSRSDAYSVFKRMVESGHPPQDFAQLLAEAKKQEADFDKALSDSQMA